MASIQTHKRRAQGWRAADETFEGLDLRSMLAFGSTFSNCTFDRCQLNLADLRQGKLDSVRFERCKGDLANFSVSQLTDAVFNECALEQGSFEGCIVRDTSFYKCRLSYSSFKGCTFKNVVFESCDLRGADLDVMELSKTGCVFDQCNLWGARVQLGCQFFNAKFDEDSIRMFAALAGKANHHEGMIAVAGPQYERVCRLMEGDDVKP